ncbi:GatB/YqeY domain-containing protein [Actinoplanes sp. L3-i22]|uniref:GatB/YqeY domain-containing protein n=1 Tax=Actinoplanes sp. L3-i22 TaxID=2836373 RepID=UPI001C8412AA|nr:GatB/YqeY domain-containing protein [Actinoplanes sp. L3-i22]
MLRDRLRAALVPAMKARDKPAVTALRSALAAIENAAAVPPQDPHHGLPAVGLGVTEAPRREQDDAEIERIVRAEISERRTAATDYDALGRPDEATRLRAEAQALETLVTPA